MCFTVLIVCGVLLSELRWHDSLDSVHPVTFTWHRSTHKLTVHAHYHIVRYWDMLAIKMGLNKMKRKALREQEQEQEQEETAADHQSTSSSTGTAVASNTSSKAPSMVAASAVAAASASACACSS